MLLVEPASKLRSIELLQHYSDIKYSQRIYLKIPKLTDYKSDIEQYACKVAQERFNEPFYFVLYDVTTLYFESFKADELKNQGFIKDNKSRQPQIVIGLLVTQSGFHYHCFKIDNIICFIYLNNCGRVVARNILQFIQV